MKIKFENFSVSGIYREYAGFILSVPGHALGNKAVIAEVPDEHVADIRQFLAINHPAITMAGDQTGSDSVPVVPAVSPVPETAAAEPEVEPAAETETETEPAAEPAVAKPGKKGGR